MNMRKIRMHIFVLLVLAMMGLARSSYAQEAVDAAQPSDVSGVAEATDGDDALMDPNLYKSLDEAHALNMKIRKDVVAPSEIRTLFFTDWQYKLLQEAKMVARTRPIGEEESLDDEPKNRPRGIRELALGGILYKTNDSWIVWLNGQRITPDAIPKQVMDIRVEEDYIELKWFDAYTQLIFPVRMQPHQRFNLDTRMFLPGTSNL